MLKLSKLTDYATVILTFMARDEGISRTANDVAIQTHIQLPTVSKILKKLTRANLLNSERGASGGYRLARAPKEITLSDIIRVMETQQGVTDCSSKGSHCQIEPYCFIRGNWQIINRAIYSALDGITLADLGLPVNAFSVKPIPIKTTVIEKIERRS